jgi:putative flippase GtrA
MTARASACMRRVREANRLIRWLKFNLVGAIGIVAQFAALFFLKTICHIDYLLATAFAVEAAVVHNFVWHEQFTWADRIERHVESRWRATLRRFARFNLANGAVSILGNVSLMQVLAGWGRLNYLLANAIAIALCSVGNFLVSDAWVFRRVNTIR